MRLRVDRIHIMTTPKIKISSREFWDFVNLPENDGRFFERINGEIVEYMASNPYSSAVSARIITFLGMHLLTNDVGYVTGEAGGYDATDDDTFAPGVAFIRYDRQANLPYDGFNPTYPDFVVE